MSDGPPIADPSRKANPVTRGITAIGQAVDGQLVKSGEAVRYLGGISYLASDTASSLARGVLLRKTKFNWASLGVQMVRVGVRSIPIVVIVQIFIGMILALQMAPALATYGQLERVAEVVSIAVIRELGPLLTGVVLSGFAGASIAAEIGTMVESEEIKALRAHALNPIRFLVVPRVVGTTIMIVALTVIADYVGVAGGFLTGVTILDIAPQSYLDITQSALKMTDFFTGLLKAGVFGCVIAMIACYEGLKVTGGPEGVGRATTATVVKSIVALIGIDALFTAVFYTFGI